MGIFDKAKEMAAGNPDKANAIVDKAGEMVDEKTGGQHAEHVDKGQDFLRGQVGGEPQAPADVPPTEAAHGEVPPQESLGEAGVPPHENPPA
jgi:hypothetical protein